ncbi:Sodium-dependent glucose transporter 1 [Holothuria leucospilota]|uniref:Sodium-dependent glucose transporter 1 n=1 Tax=Holothuria leucospilota TaxID=206669 RepID=A0A9Q1CR10_HOLLE|nr:Sodium-dependent glucose transporter 1 [Holothuria leucospilota]
MMIMFVVGFASGILKKGAKMVSLGIGKTQANGFFRLIYLSFAVGAFISTLLVIPFSSPEKITNDPNATKIIPTTLTTNQIASTGTTEEAPPLQSLTNYLNIAESSLRQVTTTFNESSDIFNYTQALAAAMNNMIISVCGSNNSSLESSSRDSRKFWNWNKDSVDTKLLNTAASSFKNAANAVDNILNETQLKLEELSIFIPQSGGSFVTKVCLISTKHIKKCLLKEINETLEIVLPAEQLETDAPEKLEDGKMKLKQFMSNTNSSLDFNSIATELRNLNSASKTVLQLFKTIKSYTDEKVIKRYIITVENNVIEYQKHIDNLLSTCSNEKLAGIEEVCKHFELNITSLAEFENDGSISVHVGDEILSVEDITLSFQKNVFEKLGCPAVDMTHVGKDIREYCDNVRTRDDATVISYLNEFENQIDYVIFNCTFLQSLTKPPTVTSPTKQEGTSATNKTKEGEIERIIFDLSDACSEVLAIPPVYPNSEDVIFSVNETQHLTDDKNTNRLSLNLTEFKQTVKTIAAIEISITNTTRLLYQAQHIVTLMQNMSEFILRKLSNDDICNRGLYDISTNLLLIVHRFEYCKTRVQGAGNFTHTITSLIKLLKQKVNDINNMTVNTLTPLTEEESGSLKDISEDKLQIANGGSGLVAELISYSSDANKLIMDICTEKINNSLEEFKLTSENSKNIANLCSKLPQTDTSNLTLSSLQPPTESSESNTRPVGGTPNKAPVLTESSTRPDSPTSTKVTKNVYLIIAVYLGLVSLLFLVLIRIPPLTSKAPPEELSGDWKIGPITVVFFFHLLYATAEVSFGAFVLVSYRTIFADCSFVPVVLFWGSFVLGRGISLFLGVVISLTQYLVFSLAGNIVASIILVFLPSYGTYMFLLGTVVLAISMSTLFHTGDRWLKEHLPGGYVSNTFKYLFIVGDALGGGVGPLLVGYFMGVDKTTVTTPLIHTISVTNVLLLFLFAYAFSVTKGMNHPDLESGKFNQEENVVSTTLDRVSKPIPNTTIYAQPKSKQTAKARKYKD